MQLTKNFKLQEFEAANSAARFGLHENVNAIPGTLIENVGILAFNLQQLRNELNAPIRISSGYRAKVYNDKVGSSDTSQHRLAKAADITATGFKPEQVAKTIKKLIEAGRMKQGGVGLYSTFVHYDVRGYKARW